MKTYFSHNIANRLRSIHIIELQVRFSGKTSEVKRTTEQDGVKLLPKQERETNSKSKAVKNKILSNSEATKSSHEKCQPKTNVVFVKTVKTGGSTLGNVLGRFAMKHNLNIHGYELVLNPGLRLFGMSRKWDLNYTLLGESNVINSHIKYNRTILSDVMPNDTIYVTQLRHPLNQLVSWLNYNHRFNVKDPVEVYRNLSLRMKAGPWSSWRQLGIPMNVTEEQLQSHLHQLDQEMDLVTITEQFDLSLLLLRRKLCWDISDMLYIPLKKATYKFNKNIDSSNIQDEKTLNKKYQILNPNAYSLYNHFNKTFLNLIDKMGPDLREELTFFQQLSSNVHRYCSQFIEYIIHNATNFLNIANTTEVLNIPTSKWGIAHTVDPVDCAMMKLHRNTFGYISVMKKVDLRAAKTFPRARRLKMFSQPIHPKYGIPLSVLTDMTVYDVLHVNT